MYAPERLTAEACIQHEAFTFLVQKQQKRLQRQQYRPYVKLKANEVFMSDVFLPRKTVLSSFNTSQSQFDHSSELVHFSIPFVDSRLSKWYIYLKKIDKLRYSMRSLSL